MNTAQLDELQRQRTYPSITVLINTAPGQPFDEVALRTARDFVRRTEQRLIGDVDPQLADTLTAKLADLIDAMSGSNAPAHAIAFCVSPDYSSAIRIAHRVVERVVIDDTFATRDLVADLNRTKAFRVVTISNRMVRAFVGDRVRLIEERDEIWPILRDDASASVWVKTISDRLAQEQAAFPLPTVVAGVDRTVRHSGIIERLDPIARVAGNHDRTRPAELHRLTWPAVAAWLRAQGDHAVGALDNARSARRYADGVSDLWALAHAGRVDTLVVEEHYAPAARIAAGRVEPADDRESPDVTDDVVDELIEAVLLRDGTAVMVPDDTLVAHQRVAAVLRY